MFGNIKLTMELYVELVGNLVAAIVCVYICYSRTAKLIIRKIDSVMLEFKNHWE